MSMLHDIANVHSYINIGSLKYNNNKIDGSINTSYYYYGHVGLCHNFIVALRHLMTKTQQNIFTCYHLVKTTIIIL